jgi:ABC-2 type transport system ATP-binding protein
MLKVKDLRFEQSSSIILDKISLEVSRGQIFGLIGPNSSGKSLLLEVLSGRQGYFEGDVRLGSYNLKTEPTKAKSQFGYLPNPVILEDGLTGYELLELVGSLYSLGSGVRRDRILQLASQLGCHDDLYSLLERQGFALKQKIGLIAALIHQPSLLFLDEPILHQDPTGQERVIDLLKEEKKRGTSILLASNNLPVVEELADVIGVVNEGGLWRVGSLAQLRNQTKSKHKGLAAIYGELFNG